MMTKQSLIGLGIVWAIGASSAADAASPRDARGGNQGGSRGAAAAGVNPGQASPRGVRYSDSMGGGRGGFVPGTGGGAGGGMGNQRPSTAGRLPQASRPPVESDLLQYGNRSGGRGQAAGGGQLAGSGLAPTLGGNVGTAGGRYPTRPNSRPNARPGGFVPGDQQGTPTDTQDRPGRPNRPDPERPQRPGRPGQGQFDDLAIAGPASGARPGTTRPHVRPTDPPDFVGSDRPDRWPGNSDRYPNRPNRPNRPDRDRPDVVVNRPTINQVTNITNNNITNNVVNNNVVNNNIVNNQVVNNNINVNRGQQWTWNERYHHQHYGWHHGNWNNSYRPPVWTGGAYVSWMVSPGEVYNYYNPFFGAGIGVAPGCDYSRPIILPGGSAPDVGAARRAAALRNTTQARSKFRRGDLQSSLDYIDRAIAITPDDPTLHEFRSLILFAGGDYPSASAAIYAVLAVGPGWDWDTLAALYPDVNVYTQQVRALADYVDRRPGDADARFLLAYHLMTIGYWDAALDQLYLVARAYPDDRVTAGLIASIESDQVGIPR